MASFGDIRFNVVVSPEMPDGEILVVNPDGIREAARRCSMDVAEYVRSDQFRQDAERNAALIKALAAT